MPDNEATIRLVREQMEGLGVPGYIQDRQIELLQEQLFYNTMGMTPVERYWRYRAENDFCWDSIDREGDYPADYVDIKAS